MSLLFATFMAVDADRPRCSLTPTTLVEEKQNGAKR